MVGADAVEDVYILHSFFTKKQKGILEIALRRMGEVLDEFVGACMEDGKPKAPDYKSLMRVRGYLPPGSKNALRKNGNK